MTLRDQLSILLAGALLLPAGAGLGQVPEAPAAQAAPAVQQAVSPAERQFRAWLAAFNAGDQVAYEAFLRESFPSRIPRLDGDLEFLQRTGGFDLRRVESATDTSVTCLVQERAWEQVARAVVEIEAAPPGRITRLALNLVPRPAEMAARRLDLTELAPAVRAKVNR
jgi:hypothetical protein